MEEIKKELKDLVAGDKVYVDCDSSFGASSCGPAIIKRIEVRYDSKTGVPFNVIVLKDGSKFDSRHGGSRGGSAYYIVPYWK